MLTHSHVQTIPVAFFAVAGGLLVIFVWALVKEKQWAVNASMGGAVAFAAIGVGLMLLHQRLYFSEGDICRKRPSR